jgi:hypothetical protein
VTLSGSIGISVFGPGDGRDADALIRNADAAMYIAKRDGKGGYRLFELAMHEGVVARLELYYQRLLHEPGDAGRERVERAVRVGALGAHPQRSAAPRAEAEHGEKGFRVGSAVIGEHVDGRVEAHGGAHEPGRRARMEIDVGWEPDDGFRACGHRAPPRQP